MMSNFANPFLAQAKDNNGNLKMLEDTIRSHKDYCIFGIAIITVSPSEDKKYLISFWVSSIDLTFMPFT